MYRLSLLFFVTMWLAAQGAPSVSPDPMLPKDLGYLSSMDSAEEMPEIDNFRTKQFGELRTVLSTIKLQFREIIEDLLSQLVNYIKDILKQLKLKLLKKLNLFSVSDVIRPVIDGLTDFVVEPVPEYYEPVREPVHIPIEPSYSYRPFSLASLLGAKRDAE